jgi:CheY-like chemotaxis protein
MVSFREPADAFFCVSAADPDRTQPTMQSALPDRLPGDVLIVEDDPIIALGIEDVLSGFGVKTVRVAGSVARALAMIAERVPEFALLDVGLVREKSFAVAERLQVLKIPFIFVTGYGAEVRLPPAFADTPRLAKPCPSEALQALLKRSDGDARR